MNRIISFLILWIMSISSIFAIGNALRTEYLEVISTKKTDQDITITPSGTGNVVLKDYSGILRASTGEVSAGDVDLTSEVTGILPIANGGTGSSSQNFVDLTTNSQTITGNKIIQLSSTGNALLVDQQDASGTGLQLANSAGGLALNISGLSSFDDDITMSGTGQLTLPVGESADRSVSPVEGMIRFNGELGEFEGYNGADWGALGSGTGEASTSSGINYILNNDLETSGTGYTAYADAADTIPVDGDAGSPTVTVARTTSDSLRGAGSLTFSKDAADRQGEGFSYDFTIDTADLAKKLVISFDYDASDADYVDGDMKVFIYDVTNSVLIRFNGEDLLGGKGKYYAQFQTDATSLSYRLILHQSTTNAAAYDLKFDNFSVGPTNLAYGTFQRSEIIDLTGSGDFTAGELLVSRTGNLVSISITEDTTFTSNFAPISASGVIPSWARPEADARTVNSIFSGELLRTAVSSDGSIEFRFRDYAGGNANRTNMPQGVVTYPVDDGLSPVRTSEDLGGREIAFRARINTINQIIASTSLTTIIYNEDSQDTTNSYDTTTGIFTVPESGRYLFFAGANLASVSATGDIYSLSIYVNGSNVAFVSYGDSTSEPIQVSSGVLLLSKGDTVDVRIQSVTDTSYSLSSSVASIFSGFKIPSPQTMLETETVAASYTSNAGQSIPDSTDTTVIYEDINFDTHGAYNISTGVYTVPMTGFYQVNAKVEFPSLSADIGELLGIYIKVDSATVSREFTEFSATNTVRHTISTSDVLYLLKDQELSIETFQSTGASSSLDTGVNRTNFSIVRNK